MSSERLIKGCRDVGENVIGIFEAPNIQDEYGIPFQVFYGVSANTRSAWSIANARRIIGYAPEDNSEVVYADEIREMMLEPARQTMVQGEARGGKGSR